MSITLNVSEVRQALQRASGSTVDGTGSPGSALTGTIFHRVIGELLREDSESRLEQILCELDPDLQAWKQTLAEQAYDRLLGPLLTRHATALRDRGDQVLDLWAAMQSATAWLAELWWQITAHGTANVRQQDWFQSESQVVLDLQQPDWNESVAIVGQTDALLRHPGNGAWCVLEWKTGQTAPAIDLAQACLYHLMINGRDPAIPTALAVVSFLPSPRETLFSGEQLAAAQARLLDFIGVLAGVKFGAGGNAGSVHPDVSHVPPASSLTAADGTKQTAAMVTGSSRTPQNSGNTAVHSENSRATPLPAQGPCVTAAWMSEVRDGILRVLRKFGAPCREAKVPVVGPAFVRFFVFPESGIRQKAVLNKAPELQLHLKLETEPILTVIDGAIAVDLPNPVRQFISFADLQPLLPQRDPLYGNSRIPVGVDLARCLVWCDLAASESPHILAVGTSGSGKSQWLRAVAATLIATNTAETLQLLLIDPKRNAFTFLEGSEYLQRPIVIPDGDTDISEILERLAVVMDQRYDEFASRQCQSLTDFVRAVGKPLPRIVCICDEYADLLESSSKAERQAIERQLKRISAKGRAAGIHLILATQQPRATVITSAIRSVLPAKIVFRVTDARESRVALEDAGAERLLGHGDLLFKCIGTQRLQGAWLPDEQTVLVHQTGNSPGQ